VISVCVREASKNRQHLRRGVECTTITARLIVHGWSYANHGSSIGTNIVFVGAELAPFGCNALKFLLGWSVSIANLHREAVWAKLQVLKLLDHSVADVTTLESSVIISQYPFKVWKCDPYLANPTPRLFPIPSRRILLERIV